MKTAAGSVEKSNPSPSLLHSNLLALFLCVITTTVLKHPDITNDFELAFFQKHL